MPPILNPNYHKKFEKKEQVSTNVKPGSTVKKRDQKIKRKEKTPPKVMTRSASKRQSAKKQTSKKPSKDDLGFKQIEDENDPDLELEVN